MIKANDTGSSFFHAIMGRVRASSSSKHISSTWRLRRLQNAFSSVDDEKHETQEKNNGRPCTTLYRLYMLQCPLLTPFLCLKCYL